MTKYILQIKEIANKSKYTNWYCNIIEKALLRPQDRKILKESIGYVEHHHILPRCFELGGESDADNLVFLTAKEHFIVHLLATKMFESTFKQKMIFAFRNLRCENENQERYFNSRLYEKIKPDFTSYIRLYKSDQVKYINKSELVLIDRFVSQGWSKEMTDEYKVGRVGNMKGKKHSAETKEKMSKAGKGRPCPAKGLKRDTAIAEKQKDTLAKRKSENPEYYKEIAMQGGALRKEMYAKGEIKNKKGENHPMHGKKHSEESVANMKEGMLNAWAEIKKDPIRCAELSDIAKKRAKETWSDPELKNRAAIFNSKAFQKYGMPPQEYYNLKLKPLIYLGFLPTAIVRYNLIDMCAASIKRLVYVFGTKEDQQQFELNKKNGAGANRVYIKFQEDQYNKYFNPDFINPNPKDNEV